jgi:hypothetical protein
MAFLKFDNPVEDAVAEVLESVPARGFAEVRGKYEKLMVVGVDAVRKLAELILEEGHGDDSKVRIAFGGLAIYAGQRDEDRKAFAEAISIELETAAPATVKMFLMQQALIAGAVEAEEAIGKLILDEEVGVEAVRVLVGLKRGEKAMREALDKAQGKNREAIVLALQELKKK